VTADSFDAALSPASHNLLAHLPITAVNSSMSTVHGADWVAPRSAST
jgi:hypothetical protein